jgi:hypothetical protein
MFRLARSSAFTGSRVFTLPPAAEYNTRSPKQLIPTNSNAASNDVERGECEREKPFEERLFPSRALSFPNLFRHIAMLRMTM